MELRHLRYFVAVVEERGIGRAALRLHVSQPPLTRQIQQLEETVGTKLLNRTAKGVELTDAGQVFFEDARHTLEMVTRTQERAKAAARGQIGRLDIAVFGSAMLGAVPELLLRYRTVYPGIQVTLHTMNKGAQIDALRQRRIDVAFNRVRSDLAGIATEPLRRERLFVATNMDGSLAKHDGIELVQLTGRPLVLYGSGGRPNFLDAIYELCSRKGFRPNVSQVVEDAVTTVGMVAAGFGDGLVPESVKHVRLPGITYIPLLNLPSDLTDLNCLYMADNTSAVVSSFIGTLREFRKQQE